MKHTQSTKDLLGFSHLSPSGAAALNKKSLDRSMNKVGSEPPGPIIKADSRRGKA